VKRYEESVPILDKALNRALSLSPPGIREQVNNLTFVANVELIKLETQALKDVIEGHPDKSINLLFSDTYKFYKTEYSQGMSILYNYILTQSLSDEQLKTTFTFITICVLSLIIPISCVIGFDSILQRDIAKRIQATQKKKQDRLDSNSKKLKNLLLNDFLNNFQRINDIQGETMQNKLGDLLRNPKVKKKFHSFCQKEWSLENLLIYDEIQTFHSII
jgi:hypothetical protein